MIFTIYLSILNGQNDYHFVQIKNPFISFAAALTGTIGILGISIAFKRIKILKRVFIFLGHNSLFIMETHERFMLKDLLMAVVLIIAPNCTGTEKIVIEIVGIFFIEIILCIIVAPATNRLLRRLSGIVT